MITQEKLDQVKDQYFPQGSIGLLDMRDKQSWSSRLINRIPKIKEMILVKSNDLKLVSKADSSSYIEINSSSKDQNIGILKSVLKKVI